MIRPRSGIPSFRSCQRFSRQVSAARMTDPRTKDAEDDETWFYKEPPAQVMTNIFFWNYTYKRFELQYSFFDIYHNYIMRKSVKI